METIRANALVKVMVIGFEAESFRWLKTFRHGMGHSVSVAPNPMNLFCSFTLVNARTLCHVLCHIVSRLNNLNYIGQGLLATCNTSPSLTKPITTNEFVAGYMEMYCGYS